MSWWRHQIETLSALLALCAGNSPVIGEFPHKYQWHGALIFSLICAWINGWVNNREAGDLRRHRAHYDVIVIIHTCHNPSYSLAIFFRWEIKQSVAQTNWSVRLDATTRDKTKWTALIWYFTFLETWTPNVVGQIAEITHHRLEWWHTPIFRNGELFMLSVL